MARVLQALLQDALGQARGQAARGQAARGTRTNVEQGAIPFGAWADEAWITGQAPGDLGCDSLEALWLSSAACEMFDLAATSRHHGLAASGRFGDWLDVIMAAWDDGPRTITVFTSGTTGRPKRVTHDLAKLEAEVRHFAEAFAGTRRVLGLVPAHHLYGLLFTALLPEALDAVVLDGAMAIEAVASPQPGDLVVAFPERWLWLERVVRRWPPGVRGVTSTAPCPRDCIEALAAAGLTDFTEIYGSTETGGIATRAWPETAYRLLPRWAFAGDGAFLLDQDGRRFALPDRIEHRGAGGFVPAGRRDGAVQVGGHNVDPEGVAAALRRHPGVAEAAVRLMRPDEGLRLKAFIVAAVDTDEACLRPALDAWARSELASAARPRAFRFGPALPCNALGKLIDW